MKNKEIQKGRILFVFAGAAIITVIIVIIMTFQFQTETENPRVGCVLIGEHNDKGWNESHYKGLLKACKSKKCTLKIRENVKEKRLPVNKAVDELVADGCNVIFLTSYGYGRYADAIAKVYPDTAFYVESGNKKERNLTTYFARLYQVRYLAGIAAGAATKSNILGYVAGKPNTQTNRGINAFALGARLVNPDARIFVYWTRSWDNRAEEKKAVQLLKKKGADVLTYHEDKAYTIEAAEEEGICSIGYDAIYEEWSEKFLTAALYNWEIFYQQIIEDYLSGRANFSKEYWIGLEGDTVKLAPFSPLVSEDTKKLIAKESERIMKTRDVFSGLIYDNNGKLRCEENERISDMELFSEMNWLVEGVEIAKE